ncbi:MAG: crosslink repair DNA glycosylase YcaQ family protein [Bacteroidota bacterium]
MIYLTESQARRLTLSCQGLWGKTPFAKRESGVHQVIEQLGYIQIDTISVIQRSHHHVCWTRVPTYEPKHLHQLIAEKRVFEYWSHAAAFLPMRDYRFSLPRKEALRSGKKKHWHERDQQLQRYVLDRIAAEGPLQSRDFDKGDHATSAWWGWKPAKRALEQLFMEGQLMIQERRNFQKVYEVTERVLPAEIDTRFPTDAEMARHLIAVFLQAHGLAQEAAFTHLRKSWKKVVRKELKEMEEEGLIQEIRIAESDQSVWVWTEHLEQLPIRKKQAWVHLLSPFDNVVIQRDRLSFLFGFDYLIECYVPRPKRQFGYFSLPILFGEEMVGRTDLKADRKKRILLVQHLWLESPSAKDDSFIYQLSKKLWEMARVHDCDSIQVNHIHPPEFREVLEKSLQEN